MSIFRRSWLYITRKRSRSILLLIIMIVSVVFAMLSLTIKAGADKELETLRKNSLVTSFTVNAVNNPYDYEVVEKDWGEQKIYTGPIISPEMFDQIMALEHVTGYYEGGTNPGVWVNLQLRPGSYYYELQEQPSSKLLRIGVQQTDLYYCANSALHEFFAIGALELAEGRHINDDDQYKALISTDLAERNGLNVGDTFNADIIFFLPPGDFTTPHHALAEPAVFEIVGLFDINFSQEASEYTSEYLYAENVIFCDVYAANQMDDESSAYLKTWRGEDPDDSTQLRPPGYFGVKVFVDDPVNLDTTVEEVRALEGYNEKDFSIELDESAYRSSGKPLRQLSTISVFSVVIVFVTCVILLGLILNMWTKTRRREMGVLLSMGVGRRNILLQLLLECVMLSAVALIIAFLLSSLLAGPVGNLAEKMVSPPDTGEAYKATLRRFDFVVEMLPSGPVDLTYGLTALNILMVSLMVLISTAISVVVSSWNVMKLNPKHVLTRF